MEQNNNREKCCVQCGQPKLSLYRARVKERVNWGFYCEICLLKLKDKFPELYQYGGTWKKNRKKK